MREVKEEARVAINQLKQCLQQSLVRKENMVEDLMRAERDKALAAEGIKLREESATAAARAAEKELNAEGAAHVREGGGGGAGVRAASLERGAGGGDSQDARERRPARRAADLGGEGDVELGNLRRRHEETQETLRSVRSKI